MTTCLMDTVTSVTEQVSLFLWAAGERSTLWGLSFVTRQAHVMMCTARPLVYQAALFCYPRFLTQIPSAVSSFCTGSTFLTASNSARRQAGRWEGEGMLKPNYLQAKQG